MTYGVYMNTNPRHCSMNSAVDWKGRKEGPTTTLKPSHYRDSSNNHPEAAVPADRLKNTNN